MAVLKLNPMRFGIAVGTFWALAIFLAGVYGIFTGATDFIETFNDFYPGYTNTWIGSFIGLVFGFIDGFFVGFLTVIFYNMLAKCKWLKKWD